MLDITPYQPVFEEHPDPSREVRETDETIAKTQDRALLPPLLLQFRGMQPVWTQLLARASDARRGRLVFQDATVSWLWGFAACHISLYSWHCVLFILIGQLIIFHDSQVEIILQL